MKTLAALAIAMMVSTASASAVPGFTFKYTCTANTAEVTDGKDDALVKADIAIHLVMVDENHAQPGFFVTATHTLASGVTYNVFDKYPDAQTGKVIEWGVPYWKAKDKKDKATTVFAFAAYEDNVYTYHVDFIKGLGSKSEKIVKRVTSTCTQVSP
jgi:hypothetical protein